MAAPDEDYQSVLEELDATCNSFDNLVAGMDLDAIKDLIRIVTKQSSDQMEMLKKLKVKIESLNAENTFLKMSVERVVLEVGDGAGDGAGEEGEEGVVEEVEEGAEGEGEGEEGELHPDVSLLPIAPSDYYTEDEIEKILIDLENNVYLIDDPNDPEPKFKSQFEGIKGKKLTVNNLRQLILNFLLVCDGNFQKIEATGNYTVLLKDHPKWKPGDGDFKNKVRRFIQNKMNKGMFRLPTDTVF
jgi:hypothetical protein